MFLSFNHVAYISTALLFMAEQYSIVQLYYIHTKNLQISLIQFKNIQQNNKLNPKMYENNYIPGPVSSNSVRFAQYLNTSVIHYISRLKKETVSILEKT